MKKVVLSEFLTRAYEIHKDKFDYSNVVCNGWASKIEIICKKHGHFNQGLGDHLQGKQCPKCSQEERPDIWKNEELDFLINNYQSSGRKFCAKELGKTVRATRAKAGELKLTRKQHPRPKHDNISSEQIGNIFRGAKERNLEFDISLDEIYDKFLSQNKKCALSGIDICFNKNRKKTTASVDRIDSNIGYVLSNIQIVHKEYNRMKTDFQEKEFFEMCKNVYLNLKNKYE